MTKPTTASTSITENHNRCRRRPCLAAGPTLGEIGAPRLLTNGMKLRLPEIGLDLRVPGPAGDLLLHPLGLPDGVLLRPDLDGVDEVGDVGRLLGEAAPELR